MTFGYKTEMYAQIKCSARGGCMAGDELSVVEIDEVEYREAPYFLADKALEEGWQVVIPPGVALVGEFRGHTVRAIAEVCRWVCPDCRGTHWSQDNVYCEENPGGH